MMSVLSAGVVTAVGHRVAETAASVASGICRYRATKLIGTRPKPIVAAPVLPLGPDLEGAVRGMRLARPALAECVGSGAGEGGRMALILCTRHRAFPMPPPPRLSLFDDLERLDQAWRPLVELVCAELEQVHGIVVAPEHRIELARGQAGGLAALSLAEELLASGAVERCLVGGVEGACEARTLEWLDLRAAIDAPGAPAIVSGDAAAFVLLGPERPERVGLEGSFRPGTTEPGGALAAAALDLVERARARGIRVSTLLCDLNGERRRALAHSVAMLRAFGPDVPARSEPVGSFGDVGAAWGSVALALGAHLAARAGQAVLCMGSSYDERPAQELAAASVRAATEMLGHTAAAVDTGSVRREGPVAPASTTEVLVQGQGDLHASALLTPPSRGSREATEGT
ncbi:MAG: hypothetical protein IT373_37580 [Polyangiaceae bacterium]|nr:hypothetical protein [Polyangiaceae bacterium]